MRHRPSLQSRGAWQRFGLVGDSGRSFGGDPSRMSQPRQDGEGSVSAQATGWNSCGTHLGQIQSRRRELQEQASLWKRWKTKRPEEEGVGRGEVAPE